MDGKVRLFYGFYRDLVIPVNGTNIFGARKTIAKILKIKRAELISMTTPI